VYCNIHYEIHSKLLLPVSVADGILDTMKVGMTIIDVDKMGSMELGAVITDDKVESMEVGDVKITDDEKLVSIEVDVIIAEKDELGTMEVDVVKIPDDDKLGAIEVNVDITDLGTMEVDVIGKIIDDDCVEGTTKGVTLVVTERTSLTVPSPRLL